MSVMDVIANIGMRIRGYFWKLGYLAGRFFGEAGKKTFDDAFQKGVSSIAMDSVDLDGMMASFEDHWKNEMNTWASGMSDELDSFEGAQMVLVAMAPLLFPKGVGPDGPNEEQMMEIMAAYAAFSAAGWSNTEVLGTNDGVTFTADDNGTKHMQVNWNGSDNDGAPQSIVAYIGLNDDGDVVILD